MYATFEASLSGSKFEHPLALAVGAQLVRDLDWSV
jgi:hypothetical protein